MRPPTSAGWSATATSSMRRCCTAAPRSSTRASRSARPTPARSGASSPSTAASRCSPRRPRSAPSRRKTREGKLLRQIRSVEIPHAVPRRRARRSRHHPVGRAAAEEAGDRSLVADRDRLGDRRQSGGPRPACRSSTARRPWRCRATTCAWSTRQQGSAARHDGLDRDQAAAAAGVPADAVAARTSACDESYLAEFPGYYKTADAGFKRRGRLRLRHGPHRRHHQRRRPPALHRRHGGGAGRRTRTSPNAR